MNASEPKHTLVFMMLGYILLVSNELYAIIYN